MRRAVGIFCGMILVASVVAALPRHQQQQPPPPPGATPQSAPAPVQGNPQGKISQTVSEVDMTLAVVNRRQKFVTDLEKSDFRIFEDNRPQEIKFFSRLTDLPLRVALLLDTSNSMRPRLQFEQDAAIGFLYNTLRPEKDMAFVMTFDSQPQVVQQYTNDLETLHNVIAKQRAGGGTALYDAMVAASEMLQNAPLPKKGPPEVRRVIVVISDGEDNLSSRTREDATDEARRAGTAVYTISTSTKWVVPEESTSVTQQMNRKWAHTEYDKVLDQFADETGGRAFFPYEVDDVAQDFMDIGTELRSQYLLGYLPGNSVADGKYRKVKVEVVGHKDLEVRTRKGYYAVPNPNGPVPGANPSGN